MPCCLQSKPDIGAGDDNCLTNEGCDRVCRNLKKLVVKDVHGVQGLLDYYDLLGRENFRSSYGYFIFWPLTEIYWGIAHRFSDLRGLTDLTLNAA